MAAVIEVHQDQGLSRKEMAGSSEAKTVDVLKTKYDNEDTTVDQLNRQATRVVNAVKEEIEKMKKKGVSHSQNTRITHTTSPTESRTPRKALYNV